MSGLGDLEADFTCPFSVLAQLSGFRSLPQASKVSAITYKESADKRSLEKPMLSSADQAWLCYPQKKSFGGFVQVGRLQRLRLPLQCRVWSLGCHSAFSSGQSQRARE